MKECISWDQYSKDTVTLADKIKATGRQFSSIVVVTRGGLFPATILSALLGIKMIDTYCVSSYANHKSGEVSELKRPVIDLENALFVDDLSDSGNTVKFIKEKYPECFFVCVYVKPDGRDQPDIYVKEYPQDTWIVQPWEID